MAISVDLILGYLITIFKFIFGGLARLITGLSSDFGKTLLLIISFVIGWYLIKSYERNNIKKWLMTIIVGLLIWLIFIFSLGG